MSEPARERLAQITREAHRLCSMVQAVLTAPPVWEPVDLAGRPGGGAERPGHLRRRLDVSVHGPALVLGQLVQLDRALSNLIENAAHVGRGRVRVEVRTTGGQVRVSVDDDGPGLLRAPGGSPSACSSSTGSSASTAARSWSRTPCSAGPGSR